MYFSIIFGFICIIILLVWAIYLKYVEDEEDFDVKDDEDYGKPDPYLDIIEKHTHEYFEASQPYKPLVRYSGKAYPLTKDGIRVALLTPVKPDHRDKMYTTKITTEVVKWDSYGRIETLDAVYLPVDYSKFSLVSEKVA